MPKGPTLFVPVSLWSAFACGGFAAGAGGTHAAESTSITISAEEWRAVREENRELRALLTAQQEQIDALRREFAGLRSAATDEPSTPPAPPPAIVERPTVRALLDSRVILSGEVGVALFAGGADTQFPNEEFRVDDAKLFVEAEIARNIYLFTGLDLTIRETQDEFFRLGESYLEFAELPAPWGGDAAWTVRAGRVALPFGEEYQRRGVMANPLITHSLADLWGIDEGLAAFGNIGEFDVTLAVQNGGHRTQHDFHRDKALVARVGYSPARGWRLSASAMRTGKLDRAADSVSEVWIGNGFFRGIGGAATTRTFGAELAQIDASYAWRTGEARAAYGRAWYDDDDTAADNRRRLAFYSLEGRQVLAGDVYGAVRFSRISVDGGGYPLVGLGTFGDYLFSNNFTDHLWRLGVGLGYDPTDRLRLKLEYTWERGRQTNGSVRTDSDQLAAAAGVKF